MPPTPCTLFLLTTEAHLISSQLLNTRRFLMVLGKHSISNWKVKGPGFLRSSSQIGSKYLTVSIHSGIEMKTDACLRHSLPRGLVHSCSVVADLPMGAQRAKAWPRSGLSVLMTQKQPRHSEQKGLFCTWLCLGRT